MALMKIAVYIQTFFTHSAGPTSRTVRNWIKSKKIYGEKIGGCYWVDPKKRIVDPVSGLVAKALADELDPNKQ